MPNRKVAPDEWAGWLDIYKALAQRLAAREWFGAEWEVRYNYLRPADPTGVWMQLIKKHWFDGNLHFETWVNNPALARYTVPVVLHVETSKEKHGLSRNDFSKLLLERCGEQVLAWPDYTTKPNYAMEPIRVDRPFTQESLGAVLETEMERLQMLGAVIDRTIIDVRK